MNIVNKYILADILKLAGSNINTLLVCKRWYTALLEIPVYEFHISLPLSIIQKNIAYMSDCCCNVINLFRYYKVSNNFMRVISDAEYLYTMSNTIAPLCRAYMSKYVSVVIPPAQTSWRQDANPLTHTTMIMMHSWIRVGWYEIQIYQVLSEEIQERYIARINWSYCLIFQKLSEAFLARHISRYPKYIRDIIFTEHYEYYTTWYLMSKYQNISAQFIARYADSVPWVCIVLSKAQ